MSAMRARESYKWDHVGKDAPPSTEWLSTTMSSSFGDSVFTRPVPVPERARPGFGAFALRVLLPAAGFVLVCGVAVQKLAEWFRG